MAHLHVCLMARRDGTTRATCAIEPRIGIVAATLLAVLVGGCGDEPAPPTIQRIEEPERLVPVEVQLPRDLAAACFDATDYPTARAHLAPRVADADAEAEDLLRAAIVELAAGETAAAVRFLDRAALKRPDDPRLWFNRARIARADNRLEEAVAHLKQAHALAPDDLFTELTMAVNLSDIESPDAESVLRAIISRGVEHGGSVYVAALYRLGRLQIEAGRAVESQRTMDEFQRLQDQGITAPNKEQVERGRFGVLMPPRPRTPAASDPRPPSAPLRAATKLLRWPGARGVRAISWRDDKAEANATGAATLVTRVPELLVWGSGGIALAARGADGQWSLDVIDPRATECVSPLDWDKDGDLDLVAAQTGGLHAWRGGAAVESRFAAATLALPALGGTVAAMQPVDFDHDGDLDLLVVGAFGVELLRDDGVAEGGTFTAVARNAGVGVAGAGTWCAIEDLDCDQDVDLIVGSAAEIAIFDNLRAGQFRRRYFALPADWVNAGALGFGDFDQDGRPDVACGARLGSFGADFEFRANAAGSATAGLAELDLLGDLDLDGRLDGVLRRAGTLELALALGSATAPWSGPALDATIAGIVDLDGDHSPDLLLQPAGGGDVSAHLMPASVHGALRLTLIGAKDNRRGVCAIVELRAREVYSRLFWDGEPRLLGIGGHAKADFLRVTWPNGVVQTLLDPPAGGAVVIEQKEGLVGSCPFLYTWNGRRLEYVTDVLGTTPLGLPMAPGMLVPPDHDEFVLIRGEQLAPRDGFLQMQLTEELREVTYLDRARLDVVDHPIGTEVFPNERFTFPPFPEPKTHRLVAPRGPIAARGSDGGDWTRELAAIDDELAIPFTPYRPAEQGETHSPTWGGQFQGLAPRHWLEIEFDRVALADAKLLRLVLTGWFFWTDASVNVAAARTPSIRFEPPLLQVPDGQGGWRDAGPPIGFPAGKQKSMVVDVTELLDRADPRVRLLSTLRLYWDAIRLATDDGDAAFVTTSIEPMSARLWERGFSESIVTHGEQMLEQFDWDRTTSEARWAQHPGSYTKLGETLPLVAAIDDCFVVMGSGDALELRFPATALPPLPAGWRRDYLLFLDGWAKDRDLNSIEALHVEPLPFHDMTGYPYAATESFPDDERHRRWRRDWQTRPSRNRIPVLAPNAPFAGKKGEARDARRGVPAESTGARR